MKTAIEMTREYAEKHLFPIHGWFQIDEEPDGVNLPVLDNEDVRAEIEFVYDTLVREQNDNSREDVFQQIINKEI